MLSNYERRILSEIELDLTRIRSPGSKLLAAIRSVRLPMAMITLGAAMSISIGNQVAKPWGAVLVAGCGVMVGWLLVGAIRRRVWGPRLRARMRHPRRQAAPSTDQ